MADLFARLFVFAQRILPKHLLTSIVYSLARVRIVRVKNFLIRQFVALYDVDIQDVSLPVPDGFDSFNAFFVRELSNDARPVDRESDSIVSPVDGTVNAAGVIDQDSIFQAKGLRYSITDLLATDTPEAEVYVNGAFATIYLAPYDYHRVHAPLDGELVAARYVPGNLFSVNDATVARIRGLFVRNERLVCHFRTSTGPMSLIFVGALNVGSISSIWTGEIRPRKTGVVEQIDIRRIGGDLKFHKGDVLGWFNMGSTVILLHPPAHTDKFVNLAAGSAVRMGQAIGRTLLKP